jgi:hypothetical protein
MFFDPRSGGIRLSQPRWKRRPSKDAGGARSADVRREAHAGGARSSPSHRIGRQDLGAWEEDTERPAGRSYFILEGTDGQVHYVYYTPELEAVPSQGGLRANSFVRLRKLSSEGHPLLKIDELGDSESILRNKGYLRESAQRLIRRGLVPQRRGAMDGSVDIKSSKRRCEEPRTPAPCERNTAR